MDTQEGDAKEGCAGQVADEYVGSKAPAPTKELSEAEQKLMQLNVLKATSVRQAMLEVMAEQRENILTRARAKLTSLGVTVQDDLESPL